MWKTFQKNNHMRTVSLEENEQLWHNSYSKPKLLGANSVSLEQLSGYQEWETCSDRNKSFLNEGKIILWVGHIVNIYSTSGKTASLTAGEKPNITEVHYIEIFLSLLKDHLFYWWSYLCHETCIAASLHSNIHNIIHGSWPCQVCLMIHMFYNWPRNPAWPQAKLHAKVISYLLQAVQSVFVLPQKRLPAPASLTVPFHRQQSSSICPETTGSLS